MTDAYDIMKEILGAINKEENGYLPADLFNTYARNANRDVFNDYNTRLQNPQTAYAEKLKLEDRLAPFEKKAVQVATAGLFEMPADCAYFRAAKIKGDGGSSIVQVYALNALLCEAEDDPTINVADIQKQLADLTQNDNLVAVTLLDHDQVAKRLKSFVPGKKPSLSKPIMERAVTAAGIRAFQIYPSEDVSVYYNYYRRPGIVNLVMQSTPPTMQLVYQPLLSTGFEWEEEAMTDVVNRMVISFATYIREGGLFQMAGATAKP